MASHQQPSKRDYRSVRRWFNNLQPLVDEEQDFIRCKEDLITLRHGRECAGFDGLVESVVHKLNCRLVRYIFCTPVRNPFPVFPGVDRG
jgi:polyphosphate kinase 2 (PPK2 family)